MNKKGKFICTNIIPKNGQCFEINGEMFACGQVVSPTAAGNGIERGQILRPSSPVKIEIPNISIMPSLSDECMSPHSYRVPDDEDEEQQVNLKEKLQALNKPQGSKIQKTSFWKWMFNSDTSFGTKMQHCSVGLSYSCPQCGQKLLYQEETKTKQSLPPFCPACRAYFVLEGETDQLDSLTRALSAEDSQGRNELCPSKGKIVLLENHQVVPQMTGLCGIPIGVLQGSPMDVIVENPPLDVVKVPSSNVVPDIDPVKQNSPDQCLSPGQRSASATSLSLETEHLVHISTHNHGVYSPAISKGSAHHDASLSSETEHLYHKDVIVESMDTDDASLHLGGITRSRTEDEEANILGDSKQIREIAEKRILKKVCDQKMNFLLTSLECEKCSMPLMNKNGVNVCVTCPKVSNMAKQLAKSKRLEETEKLTKVDFMYKQTAHSDTVLPGCFQTEEGQLLPSPTEESYLTNGSDWNVPANLDLIQQCSFDESRPSWSSGEGIESQDMKIDPTFLSNDGSMDKENVNLYPFLDQPEFIQNNNSIHSTYHTRTSSNLEECDSKIFSEDELKVRSIMNDLPCTENVEEEHIHHFGCNCTNPEVDDSDHKDEPNISSNGEVIAVEVTDDVTEMNEDKISIHLRPVLEDTKTSTALIKDMEPGFSLSEENAYSQGKETASQTFASNTAGPLQLHQIQTQEKVRERYERQMNAYLALSTSFEKSLGLSCCSSREDESLSVDCTVSTKSGQQTKEKSGGNVPPRNAASSFQISQLEKEYMSQRSSGEEKSQRSSSSGGLSSVTEEKMDDLLEMPAFVGGENTTKLTTSPVAAGSDAGSEPLIEFSPEPAIQIQDPLVGPFDPFELKSEIMAENLKPSNNPPAEVNAMASSPRHSHSAPRENNSTLSSKHNIQMASPSEYPLPMKDQEKKQEKESSGMPVGETVNLNDVFPINESYQPPIAKETSLSIKLGLDEDTSEPLQDMTNGAKTPPKAVRQQRGPCPENLNLSAFLRRTAEKVNEIKSEVAILNNAIDAKGSANAGLAPKNLDYNMRGLDVTHSMLYDDKEVKELNHQQQIFHQSTMPMPLKYPKEVGLVGTGADSQVMNSLLERLDTVSRAMRDIDARIENSRI